MTLSSTDARRQWSLGSALVLLLLAALVLTPARPADAQAAAFDVIVRGGTVLDGSGAPGYDADVGIRGGVITAVGDLGGASAASEIDAAGLLVAPGFINMHSHAASGELPRAESSLKQGITSEFLYPDGGGPVEPWRQVTALEDAGLAVNIGHYIGFGAVWGEVVGLDDRSPTAAETAAMQDLVRSAMEQGAWGVTTNLDSAPQTYASTQEVIDVARAADGWRAAYQSHLRSEGTTVIESLQEAIAIGEAAGLVPLWTHAKAEGPPNWGKSVQAIEVIEDALARGTYVAGDAYPYLAGASSLARRFIPRWAADGGFDAMLARFADPALRDTIAEESEALIEERLGGPHNILIRAGAHTNRYLDNIAAEWGVRPGEAVMRLVEEHGADLSMNYWYGDEDDLVRLLQHPNIAAGCDCGATAAEATHPRNYGAFPRFLRLYVREQGLFSWEEAVRKLTGLPATQMGLVDRGFIAEGMAADITVFDPENVTDRATFEVPKQYSEGIEHVLVNGRPALADGEVTGIQAGRALWHTAQMPSRPMSAGRHVSASGAGLFSVDGERGRRVVRVAFSADQDGGPADASGALTVHDTQRRQSLTATVIGQVQASDEWASFTGIGRRASGEQVPFLVVVEEHDPTRGGRASVTVTIGDDDPIGGVLHPVGWVAVSDG